MSMTLYLGDAVSASSISLEVRCREGGQLWAAAAVGTAWDAGEGRSWGLGMAPAGHGFAVRLRSSTLVLRPQRAMGGFDQRSG